LKPKDARVVASSSSRDPSSRLVRYHFPRSRQEEDEDRYIALLEAKLTSGKKSKSGVGYLKDIEGDGLGGELPYEYRASQSRVTTLDLLGDLDLITTSRSAKVCPGSTVLSTYSYSEAARQSFSRFTLLL
jgi:hypothetical protein